MLNFIRTTKTTTGLAVSAYLLPGEYETGVKISDAQMKELNLETHPTFGCWNYTLRPHQNVN